MDLLSHLKKAKVKNPKEVVAKLAEEEYGTIEELLELKEADLTLLLKNCGVKTKSSIAVRDYLEDLRTDDAIPVHASEAGGHGNMNAPSGKDADCKPLRPPSHPTRNRFPTTPPLSQTEPHAPAGSL